MKHELEQKGKVMTTSSSGKVFYVGKNLYEEWQTIDPSKRLKDVKCPILIVTGTNDRALSVANAEKVMSEIKTAKKLVLIKGAYHCWKDAKEKLVEAYRMQAMKATIDWINEWLR